MDFIILCITFVSLNKKHKMKTLIIHPHDESTQFLDIVYNPIPNKTIITGGVTQKELIKLIEEEKLFELDKENINSETIFANKVQQSFSTHSIYTNQNGTSYVVVKKGDTFFKISQEIGISMTLLRKFNDFHFDKEFLVPGEKIYTEPKVRKSKKENSFTVDSKKTLRDISQEKGIRLKSLVKKNNTFTPDQHLPKGTKVFLK